MSETNEATGRGDLEDGGDTGNAREPEQPDGKLTGNVDGILEGDADGAARPPRIVKRSGSGIAARLVGLLALVLGLVGCVLAFALLAVSVRLIFSASDVADTAASPLSDAVARLETRIDQADDLIGREGVSGPVHSELQARVDGLVDTATAASQSFAVIDDHVFYRWLPIDKEELASRLGQIGDGAAEVSASASSGTELSASAAAAAGERLNNMQTAVSTVDDLVDATVDSLTTWIRLAGFGGLLLSLWNLWAQMSLTKRGWRGVRGR